MFRTSQRAVAGPGPRARRFRPTVEAMEDRVVMTTLYAVGSGVGDGSSNLYRISNFAAAPVAVNVGETHAVLTDLAINPRTGIGYAISFSTLYRINLSNGVLTTIGNHG